MRKEAAFSDFTNTVGDLASSAASPVVNYFNPPPDPGLSADANKKIHQQMGRDMFAAGAGGLGAGLLVTRLQQILSRLNKPDEKYTKFAPGAQTVDDAEKIATWAADIAENAGRFILSPVAPAEAHKGDQQLNWSPGQKAIRTPAVIAAAGLSGLAGIQIMNSIYAKKKKEELNETVQAAKKEYERALMGKRGSAELDRAFEKASTQNWTDWLTGAATSVAKSPFHLLNRVDGLREAYWTGLLGTGVAAGKMTYDWTRERSRDKAIERARRARARMAGTAPVYVDPEQLVAVKKLIEK